MPDRPNILLIMSDEHDAGVMGCYGDPVVRTSRLDALAASGIAFDACYCNSPLCVPSRLSFTAGQYVSRCGAWTNDCWLPSDDYPSLPRALNQAGYQPYLCGKQHYDATRRYGFRDLMPWMNRSVKHGRGGRRKADDFTANVKSWDDRSAQFRIGGLDDSYILLHDHDVTQTARGFLQGRSPDDDPFLLFAGYLAPHFPLITPQSYADLYTGKVPMPTIPEGLLEKLPGNYKHLRAGFGVMETAPDVVRRGRELYWALTHWFDDQVSLLLDGLSDSRVADNTIVIYTSDHGENKGDHGLWWKNCMYDHGARIPLIVSWPERWTGGQRRSGVCSSVDLVQTITELCGASPDAGWDGDSLLPYMDDADAAWKNRALSEYYGHNIASGFTMLREDRWKYVYHAVADSDHSAERELYDMRTDPQEFTNLADSPDQAERVKTMHAAMVSELGEDPDAIEQRCRADLARGYDRSSTSD